MRIKNLKLFTNQLESELKFYTQTLGFTLIAQRKNSFSIKAGWTKLEFEEAKIKHNYHYCFLIPSTLLAQALEWMESRVNIIKIEDNRKTQGFAAWNAESFYFFDGSGNLAEFIVHYDLISTENSFDLSKVLGVCEIGMPVKDIRLINNQLAKMINSGFWKGDLDRFGTNGSVEGKFLLPNYEIKKTWFPTHQKIMPQNLEVTVESKQQEFKLAFENGQLTSMDNHE